jgi:dTDP-4-dehydrorhamnose 3,5-epimerase
MEVIETALAGVKIVVPQRFDDARGDFSEIWNAERFAAAGITAAFVQDNFVRNRRRGVVRGLHYQLPPDAQGKLVRVTRGAVFDAVVDVRRGSSAFGHHATSILSAENGHTLWIPPGFAHGYCTLEDDTEVHYKVTAYYRPARERGIAWNDPELTIAWPIAPEEALLSARDRALPRLAAQPHLFETVP